MKRLLLMTAMFLGVTACDDDYYEYKLRREMYRHQIQMLKQQQQQQINNGQIPSYSQQQIDNLERRYLDLERRYQELERKVQALSDNK